MDMYAVLQNAVQCNGCMNVAWIRFGRKPEPETLCFSFLGYSGSMTGSFAQSTDAKAWLVYGAGSISEKSFIDEKPGNFRLVRVRLVGIYF